MFFGALIVFAKISLYVTALEERYPWVRVISFPWRSSSSQLRAASLQQTAGARLAEQAVAATCRTRTDGDGDYDVMTEATKTIGDRGSE